MSSALIIVCCKCASFKLEKHSDVKKGYECLTCGHCFGVANEERYCEQYPPDPNRCLECDQTTVELVEKDYRTNNQPDGEIVDLYQCENYGCRIQSLVRSSSHVLCD